MLEPASPKTQGSILQKPKSNYGDRTGKAQHDQFPLGSFFMRHSAMLVPSGRFPVPLGATGREKQNQTHHRFNPTQSSGGNPLKLISTVEKHNSVTWIFHLCFWFSPGVLYLVLCQEVLNYLKTSKNWNGKVHKNVQMYFQKLHQIFFFLVLEFSLSWLILV